MLTADRPGHRCERPQQGGGRRWLTSLSSKAQESFPWQGAQGRPQPAGQDHLLSPAPAIPSGPEEVWGGGRFPGPQLGAAGSWQSWPVSTSPFSILYQVEGSRALPGSVFSRALLKDGKRPPPHSSVLYSLMDVGRHTPSVPCGGRHRHRHEHTQPRKCVCTREVLPTPTRTHVEDSHRQAQTQARPETTKVCTCTAYTCIPMHASMHTLYTQNANA